MTYPPPPWHTHGHAVMQPFVVDATRLTLPPGFAAVAVAGRSLGVLGLIEYRPPSMLTYAELVWMPCLVTAGGKRGYFVAKMYVDSQASLAAGRELWALPKQHARFQIGEHEAIVETDDGARLVLELGRRGPAMTARAAATTLQDGEDAVVRFRGRGHARVGSARLTVREAHGLEAWPGWPGARRVPGLGLRLDDFAITMQEPERITPREAG